MKSRTKQLDAQRARARRKYHRDKAACMCAQTGCSRTVKHPEHVYCPRCLKTKNAWTREAKRKAREKEKSSLKVKALVTA